MIGTAGSIVTPVAVSATATATLLAANTDALHRIIHNPTGESLVIKFGHGANMSDRTLTIPPGGTYEYLVPATYISGDVRPQVTMYTGIITGRLISGIGTAYATEVSIVRE